jgi:hypothetical protein
MRVMLAMVCVVGCSFESEPWPDAKTRDTARLLDAGAAELELDAGDGALELLDAAAVLDAGDGALDAAAVLDAGDGALELLDAAAVLDAGDASGPSSSGAGGAAGGAAGLCGAWPCP